MFAIPNQPSLPMAYKELDDRGRRRCFAYYDRVVNLMAALCKITRLMRARTDYLTDCYGGRDERGAQGDRWAARELVGRLLTPASGAVENGD
jgi:arsenic resistance protein ArsH